MQRSFETSSAANHGGWRETLQKISKNEWEDTSCNDIFLKQTVVGRTGSHAEDPSTTIRRKRGELMSRTHPFPSSLGVV